MGQCAGNAFDLFDGARTGNWQIGVVFCPQPAKGSLDQATNTAGFLKLCTQLGLEQIVFFEIEGSARLQKPGVGPPCVGRRTPS